jgi:hypothetical protein
VDRWVVLRLRGSCCVLRPAPAPFLVQPDSAAGINHGAETSASRLTGREEEVPMFEMIEDEHDPLEKRKMLWVKICAFVVAVAAVAGVVYFFGFLPYGK